MSSPNPGLNNNIRVNLDFPEEGESVEGEDIDDKIADDASVDDDDDEEEWDEVDVEENNFDFLEGSNESQPKEISIVIPPIPKVQSKPKKKVNVVSREERLLNQIVHRAHLTTLLVVAKRWNCFCDSEIHKSLMLSIVSPSYHRAFTSITIKRYPNELDRCRTFDAALKSVLTWWTSFFNIVSPSPDSVLDITRLDVVYVKDRIREKLKKVEEPTLTLHALGRLFCSKMPKDEKTVDDLLDEAIQRHEGTATSSAILFTTLLRAMDVPCRLVVSLQAMEWKSFAEPIKEVEKPVQPENEENLEKSSRKVKWKDPTGNLGYKVPAPNLRRTKPAHNNLRKAIGMDLKKSAPSSLPASPAPTVWTEVYSRYSREWISVDPIRGKMRCKGIMEPPHSQNKFRKKQGNLMAYVVAFEEDGSVRDVTPRYTKNYNTYTLKNRCPPPSGYPKDFNWFEDMLNVWKRPFELNRDREEQEELWKRQIREPMPNSLQGFKDHPTYVLESQLKATEALLPNTKRLGLFRGDQVVFPRSAVVTVKSAETYLREGRVIKPAEIPMKFVKRRTVTIGKKRIEELIKSDGGDVGMLPLYSVSQTELFVPDPVVDGIVPKNDFGNIDLYVPSMLPKGAIHITNKGAARCAKTLGIDYSEAIVGFEFKQRRALPITRGIVIAIEHADKLISAIENFEQKEMEKEFVKQRNRVLKKWKTLILGLRIRQRLQATYGTGNSVSASTGTSGVNTPSTKPIKQKKPQPSPKRSPKRRKRSPDFSSEQEEDTNNQHKRKGKSRVPSQRPARKKRTSFTSEVEAEITPDEEGNGRVIRTKRIKVKLGGVEMSSPGPSTRTIRASTRSASVKTKSLKEPSVSPGPPELFKEGLNMLQEGGFIKENSPQIPEANHVFEGGGFVEEKVVQNEADSDFEYLSDY